MEGFMERRWGPILIGCAETPPARFLVYLLPGCPWLYELNSHSTISQCEEQMIVVESCGAGSTRGRNRLSSPACQHF